MFLKQYPLANLDLFRREMDDLFGSCLDGFGRSAFQRAFAFPAVNVWADGECLVAEAEVPGMRMEDLEVYAVGNELTVKGKRAETDREDVSYHRRERCVSEFTRVLTLPVEVDTDKVEATLKDGILTIKLPKADAARVRRIPVRSE